MPAFLTPSTRASTFPSMLPNSSFFSSVLLTIELPLIPLNPPTPTPWRNCALFSFSFSLLGETMIRPVSASRYLRGLLTLLTPLRPELLIRVPRLGRWFVLVVVMITVADGLLVVFEFEVDAEVLDEDGKIVLEAFSVFEEVRLGIEGATPLPRPAICTFFGVIGAKSNSFWSMLSCFDDGPVPVLVL